MKIKRKPQKFWSILKEAFPTKEVSNQSNVAFNIEGKQTTDNIAIAKEFCKYFYCVARMSMRLSMRMRISNLSMSMRRKYIMS